MNSDDFSIKVIRFFATAILMLVTFVAGTMAVSFFIPWLDQVAGEMVALVFAVPSIYLVLALPWLAVRLVKYLTKKDRLPLKDVLFIRKIPHFGEKMPQCLEEIRKETFSPYVTRERLEISFIEISENQKWVKIFGKYYPVDFICGYNEKENVLYTIDGARIPLKVSARRTAFKAGLKLFFEDRGHYYTELPESSDSVFRGVTGGSYEGIYKTDFGKIRYRWEIVMGQISQGQQDNAFEGVLLEKELKKIAKAIRSGRDRLDRYTDFGKYKNEYSICNGINIIRKLGYPYNKRGLDFLVDCLNDIDEPYFMLAVDELMREFPSDMLKTKLEERAKMVYEEKDVLKMAGLLFLAKKLDYDIKYIQDIKETGDSFEKYTQTDDSDPGHRLLFVRNNT